MHFEYPESFVGVLLAWPISGQEPGLIHEAYDFSFLSARDLVRCHVCVCALFLSRSVCIASTLAFVCAGDCDYLLFCCCLFLSVVLDKIR